MKTKYSFLLIVFIFLCSISNVWGQDSLNISLEHRTEIFWDNTYDAAFNGDYIYLATNFTGLKVLNISDVEDYLITDIIYGRFATLELYNENYLLASKFDEAILYIYDISNPSDPELITSQSFENYAADITDIKIISHYALLTSDYNWIITVDLADIYEPEFISEDNSPGFFTMSGEYVYATNYDSNDFNIYDYTNPENPELISTIELNGNMRGLFIANDYAYISSTITGSTPDTIYVIDISNALNPFIANRLIDHQNEGSFFSVAKLNETTYLRGLSTYIHTYNLENPLIPQLISSLYCEANHIFCQDSIVLRSGQHNSAFLDYADPANPAEITPLGCSGEFSDIGMYDDHVYLIANDGMRTYDVSNIDFPVLEQFDDDVTNSTIKTRKDKAFITNPVSVNIYSLFNPGYPYFLGSYSFEGNNIECLALDENYLYLATYDGDEDISEIQIINITDSQSPELVSTYSINGQITCMKVALDRLIVFTSIPNSNYKNIYAFDTLHPAELTYVGGTDILILDNVMTSSGYNLITHSGNLNETKIYDTSAGPIFSEIFSFDSYIYDCVQKMDISGSYALALSESTYDESLDLELYDLSDITSPQISAYYNSPDHFTNFAVDDEKIAAIDNYYLYLLLNELPSQPTEFSLISPAESQIIPSADAGNITLLWEESVSPIPQNSAAYEINLRTVITDELDTVFTWSDIDTTFINIDIFELLDLEELNNAVHCAWWVHSFENGHKRDCCSIGRFQVGSESFADENNQAEVPTEFQINSIYPNPFNSCVNISFSLPQNEKVTLKLFDILGREIFNFDYGTMISGSHNIALDGHDLSSGIYFVSFSTASESSAIRKIVLLK